MILKGRDGVSVITEQEATVPPAAQTTPPTYGQTSVAAHALVAGTVGNITVGDINEPCCVTSVIAQNPYPFTGGTNAQDYTYLTAQDVAETQATHIAQLEATAKAHFATPIVLDPHCSTTSVVKPAVGSRTVTAWLMFHAVCTALSYSRTLALRQIIRAAMQYGQVSAIQFFVVSVFHRQASTVLQVYVTVQIKPVLHLPMH